MNAQITLIWACVAMVILVTIVGARLLFVRVNEMKKNRINPQSIATSVQSASRFQNIQAADNFRNLFEVPVLFYALIAVALALGNIPKWLTIGAWSFVVSRYIHSFIHCTYNKVMHRFVAFACGFLIIVVLWVAFVISLASSKFAA